MNVEAIREFCLAFPRATENVQWGDDLCFKVAGKIFTIVSLDDPRLCFKCKPETFAELIERPDIHPAPYVGRYKWVMLDRLDAVQDGELEDLIRQSPPGHSARCFVDSWNRATIRQPKRSAAGLRAVFRGHCGIRTKLLCKTRGRTTSAANPATSIGPIGNWGADSNWVSCIR